MHGKVVGVEEEKEAVSKHLPDLLWIQGYYDILIIAFLLSLTNNRVTLNYPNCRNLYSSVTEIENNKRTVLYTKSETTKQLFFPVLRSVKVGFLLHSPEFDQVDPFLNLIFIINLLSFPSVCSPEVGGKVMEKKGS